MALTLKKGLILTGVGIVVIGAGLYVKHQISMMNELVYDTKNPKLKKITPMEAIIEIDLIIKNPTELSVTISGVDVDILANGVKASNVYSSVPTELKPNSTASVPLKISVNPQTLIQNTGILMSTGALTNINLEFNGLLKIKKFGIPIPIPFSYYTTYKEIMG